MGGIDGCCGAQGGYGGGSDCSFSSDDSDTDSLGTDSLGGLSGCDDDSAGVSETDSLSGQPTTTDQLRDEPTTAESLAAGPTTSETLSGNTCEIPGELASEAAIDDFHACTSGVTDRAVIDRAQALTQDGGCAALSDTAMLCNPVGPEIGEYTVGRPEGFPDYIGPNADYDHTYVSRASTPGGWDSLEQELNARIREVPTPGSDQTPATASGVVNDAGITPFPDTDLVRSSVSTDVQGRQVVSNVTIPGQHMLDPGIVSQTAWTEGRTTQAIAVGEGNGWLSQPANPVAREVFENKLEADIRVSIYRDTQR